MFRALEKIGVRKFEEGGKDIGIRHALFGQMAVRVEFARDQNALADDFSHALQRSPSQSS